MRPNGLCPKGLRPNRPLALLRALAQRYGYDLRRAPREKADWARNATSPELCRASLDRGQFGDRERQPLGPVAREVDLSPGIVTAAL